MRGPLSFPSSPLLGRSSPDPSLLSLTAGAPRCRFVFQAAAGCSYRPLLVSRQPPPPLLGFRVLCARPRAAPRAPSLIFVLIRAPDCRSCRWLLYFIARIARWVRGAFVDWIGNFSFFHGCARTSMDSLFFPSLSFSLMLFALPLRSEMCWNFFSSLFARDHL